MTTAEKNTNISLTISDLLEGNRSSNDLLAVTSSAQFKQIMMSCLIFMGMLLFLIMDKLCEICILPALVAI
jgi:hypothetical protein